MTPINYADLIKESAAELYALERKAGAAIVRDRLGFLRLLKSGAAASPPQAGEAFNFKRAWSYQLWKRYLAKGLPALAEYPFKGTKPKLDAEQEQQFIASLASDDITKLQDAVNRLEKEYGITYTIGGMCYVMKRLGIKKKTGRPAHIHKDEQAVQDFKKKAPELIASFEERCFFEDEMRSGTRSECKRRWREKGRRPLCKMKLGYEYCYLYAALQPFEGRLISLILPDMTKESFTLFIEHFKAETLSIYGKESKVLLIADGAGSHQADVVKGSNITLKKLPTAAPELNPAERFFEELRKDLSNQVFENIEAVEDKLCQVLQKYYHNPSLITNLANYPYLSTT